MTDYHTFGEQADKNVFDPVPWQRHYFNRYVIQNVSWVEVKFARLRNRLSMWGQRTWPNWENR